MKQDIVDLKRRNILKQSLFGLTAVAAASILAPAAYAEDLPELTEEDPMAMGLGYKKDTATVDAAKYAKHAADQNCANCQLYTSKSDAVGTCTIFAGKTVSATGWCSAYVKKV